MISRLLPDLRAQLAAVINNPPNQHQSQQQQQQHPHHQPPPPHLVHGYNDVASTSASPHNIDPAIAGAAHAHHALDMMGGSAGGDSGDDNGDGRKGGKRELSQSKRAAQNRAAQVRCDHFHALATESRLMMVCALSLGRCDGEIF